MKKDIKNYIKESIYTKEEILNSDLILDSIEDISKLIIDGYKNNKKVLVAGNGGSASDAQHIVAELVSKFTKDRKALNAIALTTNTSILTAISNDYGYDEVFARQIEAYANEGDIYIAISTSGNSKNIIKSLEKANLMGLITIGFTGNNLSEMDKLCKFLIKVPSCNTPIIQESHIMLGHIIAKLVEDKLLN